MRVGVARELPSGSLLVLVWVRGSKTKEKSCVSPKKSEVDFNGMAPLGQSIQQPTDTRVCSTDEA